MKYKRRSTGEEKVQKIAAGEEGNYRMERVPLKQTDRHHKSPGGDLCIRDSFTRGSFLLFHRFIQYAIKLIHWAKTVGIYRATA
ncbi:hypothetical protein AL502_03020 [Escherichia coli]|nr:hypothetical protein AL502_03020 [Escherichia coli]